MEGERLAVVAWVQAVALGAVLSLLPSPGALARDLAPSTDVNERFTGDPFANPAWELAGSWAWNSAAKKLVSGSSGTASAFWTGADHFCGTLTVRLKLAAGRKRRPPKARLVFARDSASGAYRYLELTAGTRGRVVLGQEGTVRDAGPGVFRRKSRTLGTSTYQTVSLTIDAQGRVTVRHGKSKLFRAQAGPLAPGQIGIVALGSRVVVDRITFAATPDGEPCLECHAGQPDRAPAPNVATYWDGSWWRSRKGGATASQLGGHGDPGGAAAVPCAGTDGCHDLRLPSPAEHRSGRREGTGNPSENTFHLRDGFIAGEPRNRWDVQLTFDQYCYVACHKAIRLSTHSHELDGIPAPGVVQFGQRSTRADGENAGLVIDQDITTVGGTAHPVYAPCVSCHDPHGSGADRIGDWRSNFMLRYSRPGELCLRCHG